ncbi:MAG: hypothetical protein K6B67_05695 [Lachnospiraceae bacterium]|nr:hypothetical protein [Lachnospiraceae bacterium]
MEKDFNEFRFAGLNYKNKSNKYFTMDRVSQDESKIVVKVADSHLLPTKFGYALILDCNHVIFIKNWQVSHNFFGNEVLLTKEHFVVKEWGDFSNEFGEEPQNLKWETWVDTAKEQDNLKDDEGNYINKVSWEK